ncbi:MAG: TolC family protein [Gammaproteobacteria bacterium]
MRSLHLALFFAGLFGARVVLATDGLALGEVLTSSAGHFPAIQSAVAAKRAQEGRTLAAEGAFDLALEQDALVWADGYYDGMAVDNRLVKPLPFANAKAFAGYRLSNDDFPVYQQERVTNDGGEFNLGVVFSLWRDRVIDERRYALANARFEVREAELDLLLARLTTQRNAARAYWNWVAAGRQLEVYQRLVALAEERMAGLEERAQAGDVARIFVTENRQNLLRRQAIARQAEQDLTAAAIELSLYLRDDAGTPRVPHAAELPAGFPPSETGVDDPGALVDAVLAQRPELDRIEVAAAAERQRLLLAENELLPRVDLGLKGAHDLGGGARSRQGLDAIVDLTVSIPLETRRGRGKVAESRARLNQLDLDRQLLGERLANEVLKLGTGLNAARDFVGITAAEAEQATLLEQAERERFGAGASDFFLVNLREERSADARIRNLESRLRYFHALADLQAITLDLEALVIAAP